MIGEILGRYKILQEVGTDSTGILFQARCLEPAGSTAPRSSGNVLLKIISPHFSRSPKLMARFREITSAQAKLDHPNIIPIIAFEQEKTTCYIVMSSQGSKTLAGFLAEHGNLSISTALDIFFQILAGLDHAHSRGLLHKNVCPANIFIQPANPPIIQIKDFGLAGEEEIRRLPRLQASPLAPYYAAPEQLLGQAASVPTDIYGLGLSLYEMLSAALPFKAGSKSASTQPISPGQPAETPSQIIESILNSQPVRLVELDPYCPADLDNLVMKCLAKSPTGRFPDMTSLALEMQKVNAALAPGILQYRLTAAARAATRQQPVQPVQPIQPVQPQQRKQPLQPVQPVQAAQPVQPVQPEQPVQPVQPAPAHATQPVNRQKYFAIASALLIILVVIIIWTVHSSKNAPLPVSTGESRSNLSTGDASVSSPIAVDTAAGSGGGSFPVSGETAETSPTPGPVTVTIRSGNPITGGAVTPATRTEAGTASEAGTSREQITGQGGRPLQPRETTTPGGTGKSGDTRINTDTAAGLHPGGARIVERMDLLLRSGDIQKAISLGHETLNSGMQTGEIYRELARAYFYSGSKENALRYFQQALTAAGPVSFPLAYRIEKDKEIDGDLEFTRSGISFRPYAAQHIKYRFAAGYIAVDDVYQHVMGDISGLFKKKKNRDNPMLVIAIKQQDKIDKHIIRLKSPDKKLRGFIVYILNTLRRTASAPKQ